MSSWDTWSWGDSPILGETTNEGGNSGGLLGSLFGVVKSVKDIQRYWNTDYGQDPYSTMGSMGGNQDLMLGAVEREQNIRGSVSSVVGNPVYVAGGVALLALVYVMVK